MQGEKGGVGGKTGNSSLEQGASVGHLRLTRAPPMARRHPSGLVGAGRRHCRPPPRAWLRFRLRFLPNDENVYCDTDSGWQYLVRHPPSAQGGRSTRRGWSWRRVSYLPIWPGKHGAYWCLPWCPSGAAELESLSLFFGGVGNVPFLFYPISVHGTVKGKVAFSMIQPTNLLRGGHTRRPRHVFRVYCNEFTNLCRFCTYNEYRA